MFNMIEALFAPGRKHTDDENKRLETTRVDLSDGDPGHGPIDLSSGKVVMTRASPEAQPAADAAPFPADADASTGPDAGPDTGTEARA